MDGKELGLTVGMCFKGALELVSGIDQDVTPEELALQVGEVTKALVGRAVEVQQWAESEYASILQERPRQQRGNSNGRSGYSGRQGSSTSRPPFGGSSASGPTPKQIAFANRLLNERAHDLDTEMDVSALSKKDVGELIEHLLAQPEL